MNADSETIQKAFRDVVTRWLPGMRVWHRSSAKRGVVTGYLVCADASILLQVAYGDSTFNVYPLELSVTRVTEDDEAEEWKEQA